MESSVCGPKGPRAEEASASRSVIRRIRCENAGYGMGTLLDAILGPEGSAFRNRFGETSDGRKSGSVSSGDCSGFGRGAIPADGSIRVLLPSSMGFPRKSPIDGLDGTGFVDFSMVIEAERSSGDSVDSDGSIEPMGGCSMGTLEVPEGGLRKSPIG